MKPHSLRLSMLAAGGSLSFALAFVACSSGSDGAPPPSTCAPPATCPGGTSSGGTSGSSGTPGATATDGIQNGTETDVDCGGANAPACADDKKCIGDADCTSDICKESKCAAPSATDGRKNGTETDVDCGGASAPKCDVGKACTAHGDCASDGCGYQQKCVARRSCTPHFGGDTCGLGGAGGVGAAEWEDCCATADVTPTAGPTSGRAIKLGKYQVTAGRMRAFLTAVNYDVRAFVKQARTANQIPLIPGDATRRVLEASWDPFLPTSFAGGNAAGELADCGQGDTTTPTGTVCKAGTNQAGLYTAVSRHLGGFIFKGNNQTLSGCFVGAPGTHAFRFPEGQQDGDPPLASQDEYDTKSMQCIDYLVAQAFCVWDGGRLETLDEWKAALGPGATPWSATSTKTQVEPTTNSYWGCRFPWATDANQAECGTPWNANTSSIEFAAYNYSYEYPKQTGADYIVFISAPGRTRGRGPAGHADLFGNNFELTSTVVYNASPHEALHRWSGNGSWEGHDYNKAGGGNTGLLNKYGKLGLRCAYE